MDPDVFYLAKLEKWIQLGVQVKRRTTATTTATPAATITTVTKMG